MTLSSLRPPPSPDHDEWLIDEAVAETFPASDPVAVAQPGSLPALRNIEERARTRPARALLWSLLGAAAIAGFLAGRALARVRG